MRAHVAQCATERVVEQRVGRLARGGIAVAALCAVLAAACRALGRRRAAPAARRLWSDTQWPSIWAARPDGRQLRRILRNRQNAKRPRLSPDRRCVAFGGAPPGTPPLTDFDIQIVRLDGTGRRTLTHSPDWEIETPSSLPSAGRPDALGEPCVAYVSLAIASTV
jgi:hypothetical protein